MQDACEKSRQTERVCFEYIKKHKHEKTPKIIITVFGPVLKRSHRGNEDKHFLVIGKKIVKSEAPTDKPFFIFQKWFTDNGALIVN